ncbi:MAG: outer membrane beta-barrel protein [Acidobacteriota bacterium]
MIPFQECPCGKIAPGDSRRSRAAAVCLGLLLSFLGAGRLRAQARPGSIEIGGGIGRLHGGELARGSNVYFDQRVAVDDENLHGFWVGAQITREWGIEVEVRRTPTVLIEPQDGVFPTEATVAGLDLATIELVGHRSFQLGAFSPYLAFGAGVANLDINVPDRSVRDSNRLTLCAAIGGRYYAARWVGVRIDVRGRGTYLGARRLQEDRGTFDSGRWLGGAELAAGIFVDFGGQ